MPGENCFSVSSKHVLSTCDFEPPIGPMPFGQPTLTK
jgi:hypothetical protein